MITPGTVYIARGNADTLPQIESALTESGISMHGSDASVRVYSHFGVDDARALVAKAQLSAIGAHRLFVVVAASMTTEAQNALLKTFEEAPGDAVFILVVPSPDTLLSTVRSRAQTLELTTLATSIIDMKAFCAATPDARIELLKPLLEKGDEDRRDSGAIMDFLGSLERILAPRITDASAQESLAILYRAKRYMGDKGALIKTLLETIACTLPRMQA